ncbi:phage integrase [Aliamphritea ceti]|uniref:phage integrase n=1 Tax=Aliamphritea ceti TaxID=1524258 RepID=UPI0021C387BE|nr:tyrosine-type recombinase/integrase [Aliamphritea ceti]
MTIKKADNQWLLDIRPEGRDGPRLRKKFDTKAEAQRYELHIKSLATQGKAWNPNGDTRRLKDLIEVWYNNRGINLRDGTRRKRAADAMALVMGNPKAAKLSPNAFIEYRNAKLQEGCKPKTLNNHLTYLKAIYNELISTKVINYQNPLEGVKPIKIAETELAYLTTEQIKELLSTIKHSDALLISKICLSTGCRWGEAQSLQKRHIRNGQIQFTDTKSGKNRYIPISQDLEKEILKRTEDKLFGFSLSAFNRALEKTSIELPKGQASHVLRHTFASHFMMNGGNILTLQKILGHSTITMTMRYAHLAPDHLQDAVKLNPLIQ